ncbi:MAG: glycogen debranching enzyme N-terminal domain-containing protein, partial [Planctomycetes bacterium]|nr:glycogen debranching enzyme N-terminal domain-containing protein [Planctomycetota bacterium]
MTDTLDMTPNPGERLLRYVGDRIAFRLHAGRLLSDGWRVLLRTNLGRAEAAREEILAHRGGQRPFAGVSWRDIPMQRDGDAWLLDLPLTQVGWFRAKAYAVDPDGRQHWPQGHDVGITVQPNGYRTANTVYCAFTRMFGVVRDATDTRNPLLEGQLKALDEHGYTVIPPSGTLRDLARTLPHIMDGLGCRILHLLPVTPTPTTYARFGRFGSPYASQDLTAIDPALVEFDKRTTGVDQFRELAFAVHLRRGRIFLDIVINHTGWGSTLQENRPEWFRRNPEGTFHSPGAWGNTWEDLVELEHQDPELWEYIAECLLTWCRRGVDGFRCDAGYMVPMPAWQYITAKIRQEFPDTVFLLEGLGGAWETTEVLLTEGNLQWAYSELFQNYSGSEVASYLDHCIRASGRVGALVHYSETHDNARLAAKGAAWSLMRNRLSALTSVSGAFGFTCGVEWLATEKIDVHQSRGMNWRAEPNLIGELGPLNRLLADHPAFFDGALLARLSPADSPVLALRRDASDRQDTVIVLVNLDHQHERTVRIAADALADLASPLTDLLSGSSIGFIPEAGEIAITVRAGGSLCLAGNDEPVGLTGESYRRARDQAALAYRALDRVLAVEDIGPCAWQDLAALVDGSPFRFLAALPHLRADAARLGLVSALEQAMRHDDVPAVIEWTGKDLDRVVPIPPGHWLLVRDQSAFSASLDLLDGQRPRVIEATEIDGGWVAAFPPAGHAGDASLTVDRYREEGRRAGGALRYLGERPDLTARTPRSGMALLTNGRGAMARIAVDLGAVRSKYDCLLGANLHPAVPCDRHVLAKRVRCWVVADGFITALAGDNLAAFEAGPPAVWDFVANAGDGRAVEVRLEADLLDGRNTAVLRFSRPANAPRWGRPLPEDAEVRVIVRVDLEDRSFHSETRRSAESESHFVSQINGLADGFVFAPASDRLLRVRAPGGRFHAEPEWCERLPHPVEAERGMTPSGDAYSPGWFELTLHAGGSSTLTAGADGDEAGSDAIASFVDARDADQAAAVHAAGFAEDDAFGRRLARSATAYVARRDDGRTVIAGYPWFLDWGRDSLICARGLLALGMTDEVLGLLTVFGRFEADGTLPNIIHGEDASNRDTSDAPLWYGVVCEDAAALLGAKLYRHNVGGRTIAEVLVGIATGYLNGTPNGICVDPATALVWSPSHFTWMDTNYPAGTPRAGYPIEIQALWIRLLRQLDRLGIAAPGEAWGALAARASEAFSKLFWLEAEGWHADLLIAPRGLGASDAVADRV